MTIHIEWAMVVRALLTLALIVLECLMIHYMNNTKRQVVLQLSAGALFFVLLTLGAWTVTGWFF